MNVEIKQYWIKKLQKNQILIPIENGCWGVQYKNQDSTWFVVALKYPNNVWEYLLNEKEWKFYFEQEALRKIKLKAFW